MIPHWGKNQNIILNYIDLEEKDEDIEFVMNDMREIRLYYYKWKIENNIIDKNNKEWNINKIKQCEECGKLIEIVKNSNKKYCSMCAKMIKSTQTRESNLLKNIKVENVKK